MKFIVCLLLILSTYTQAVEQYVPTFDHWIKASRHVGLEASLLYSMALAESGKTIDGQFIPHPFAIAVGVDKSVGQFKHEGYYPETYQQAKIILENLLSAGYVNIGVGLMQINLKANSHLVANPIDLLDPVLNIAVSKKIIGQCSNNRTITEMLSCYSHGYYDSKEGHKYASKVFEYQHQYGNTFVKRHQPVGVLTLAELTYYYQKETPNKVANNNRNNIEILTGTSTYDF